MVPKHELYTIGELHKADAFVARHHGCYFVVKPATGTSGARGVTTHLQTAKECREASVLASLYGEQILIEQWIPGESYRLLFLDGEMIHASRRKGRRVEGDGRSTVQELLQKGHLRGTGQTIGSVQSKRDTAGTLEAQGLGFESVPDAGRRILTGSAQTPLGAHVEIRTVFDEDVTEEIGPELQQQAARAVRALGSNFAGVDVITLDPTRPLEQTGGVINEINTTPGLHHHYGLNGGSGGISPAVRVLGRLLECDVESSLLQKADNPVLVGAISPPDLRDRERSGR